MNGPIGESGGRGRAADERLVTDVGESHGCEDEGEPETQKPESQRSSEVRWRRFI